MFLRWGQKAFSNFKVVPPDTGIVHQVNLEYLARVVFADAKDGSPRAYPDTLVGTDSHTTMINGLGVLGWGVGGIEAEAAMLGQPVAMLIPRVVGFRLTGAARGRHRDRPGAAVTEMLRKKGVVGKFVEFFGAASPPPACRPGDHRQHVAGVRQRPARYSRSTRRRSATWNFPAGADKSPWSRPTRRPGHVPRRHPRGPDLLRHPRTGTRHRGSEPSRPEAPPGPRRALPTTAKALDHEHLAEPPPSVPLQIPAVAG